MFLIRKFSGRSLGADKGTRPVVKAFQMNCYEEEASRKALDQASDDINEGRYERALWMLEKLSQLCPSLKGVVELLAVAEVCYATAAGPCACTFGQQRSPDWYKILKVDVESDADTIKKQYRHLALLLHPDKNKHVKAEAAFRLVSEAYACLSDKKKRAAFNLERSLLGCQWCSPGGAFSPDHDRWNSHDVSKTQNTISLRPQSFVDLSRDDWVLDQEKLKILRDRARVRILGNLAQAWRERVSKGFEEDTHTFQSDFRSSERKRWSTNRDEKKHHYKKYYSRQQNVDGKDNTVERENNAKAKSLLLPKVISEQHHWKIARPYKNLQALINDLRAELVASIGITGNRESQRWDKIVWATSERSMHGPRERLMSNLRLLSIHEDQENKEASNIGSATPTSCKKQEILELPHSSCPLKHIRLQNFQNDGSENEILPENTSSWNHFSLKLNFCNKDESVPLCYTKPKRGTSLEMVQDRPLNRWIKGTHTCSILRKDGVCTKELFSRGHDYRNDSLDMEERMLQTQKEKSEQLLKTLEHLREGAKSVAASLDHICYSSGSRIR